MPKPASRPFDLPAKFRAVSRELRARYEACRVGGMHGGEKGLRIEGALRSLLAAHLPPRYGLSRGEVVSFAGEVSRQIDIVVYDAHHAPLLQETEESGIFAAESVYATIEVKRILHTPQIEAIVTNTASVKTLDRSGIVAEHGGHRILHGPRANPPIFGAVFAFDGASVKDILIPELHRQQAPLPRECWVDCICILDKALIYNFVPGAEQGEFSPGFIGPNSVLGYYESGEDTLLLFYLFLMAQLNARDLFPPDLHRYAAALKPPLHLYRPAGS